MNLRFSTFWITSLSTAIVLFLLIIYGTIVIHLNQFGQNLKSSLNVIVELEVNTDNQDIENLINSLKENPYLISSSITHHPPEKSKNLLSQEVQEILNENDQTRAIRHMISFKVKTEHYNDEKLNSIEKIIKQNAKVHEVHIQNMEIKALENNVKKMSYIFLILALFFVLITIILIASNFKLLLIQNEKNIKTMQLIGATPGYILRPYFITGLKIGLFAWIMAVVGSVLVIAALVTSYFIVQNTIDIWNMAVIYFLVLIIGLCVPVAATHIIVKLYLKK